jgi:hypothetical protein
MWNLFTCGGSIMDIAEDLEYSSISLRVVQALNIFEKVIIGYFIIIQTNKLQKRKLRKN